jgi:hypothetical protein
MYTSISCSDLDLTTESWYELEQFVNRCTKPTKKGEHLDHHLPEISGRSNLSLWELSGSPMHGTTALTNLCSRHRIP